MGLRENIAAQFERQTARSKGGVQFIRPGELMLRILPFNDGEEMSREVAYHQAGDNWKVKVPCLKVCFGEDCPACDANSEAYDLQEDAPYPMSYSYLVNGVEDGSDRLRVYSLTSTLHQTIADFALNRFASSLLSVAKGNVLLITKRKGAQASVSVLDRKTSMKSFAKDAVDPIAMLSKPELSDFEDKLNLFVEAPRKRATKHKTAKRKTAKRKTAKRRR